METVITTEEAINTYNALNNFINKDIDLSVQIAWDIEDNTEALKKIVDRFNNYQQKILQPLQDQGGLRYEADQIFAAEGFEKQFQATIDKLNEALQVKNTINIQTITRDQLPSHLSIKDLEALKFMIEDKNNEEKE